MCCCTFHVHWQMKINNRGWHCFWKYQQFWYWDGKTSNSFFFFFFDNDTILNNKNSNSNKEEKEEEKEEEEEEREREREVGRGFCILTSYHDLCVENGFVLEFCLIRCFGVTKQSFQKKRLATQFWQSLPSCECKFLILEIQHSVKVINFI